jgi:hypothetical protein
VVACRFSGVLCKSEKCFNKSDEENGDVHILSAKEFANSKGFSIKRLRTDYFNKILTGGPFPNLDLSNHTTFSPV